MKGLWGAWVCLVLPERADGPTTALKQNTALSTLHREYISAVMSWEDFRGLVWLTLCLLFVPEEPARSLVAPCAGVTAEVHGRGDTSSSIFSARMNLQLHVLRTYKTQSSEENAVCGAGGGKCFSFSPEI